MVKLAKQDYEKIKKNIIKKLYTNNCFCKGHMLFERFKTSIPHHLSGFVKEVLKDLIKENIVLPYGKTKHGVAFQLNIKKITEIEELIKI